MALMQFPAFEPSSATKLRVLSLGAGVQSTTLALMAAHGEIGPMPDCAIFADTGWEPKPVQEHLKWLASPNVLPFPVHQVSSGNIREDVLNWSNTTGGRFASVPWFIKNPDGSQGLGQRQCTSEYKLKPIMHKLRDLLGVERRQRIPANTVEIWVGISTDEIFRMKPAKAQWQRNRWPLIEREMTRQDCLNWMERNGYPQPPKSSCIGCPFHSDSMWSDMKKNRPDEWQDAVYVDASLRQGQTRGMRGTPYMHSQCVPLSEVNLSHDDRGPDLFNNECEGMCGV
jgi:hypothetical protein